jgi:hypothetical protein
MKLDLAFAKLALHVLSTSFTMRSELRAANMSVPESSEML